MKSRQKTLRKRIVFSVFAGVFCLFFFTCGIPVYYVIEPPKIGSNIPTYETSDQSNRYFSFICPYSSSSDNSEFSLLGTGIYYRIYDSVETMNSDINSINGRNGEYSENGYFKMIELNYQPLLSTPASTPIVKKITSSRTVELRLCNEGTYTTGLKDVTNNTQISVPYRYGISSSTNATAGFQFTSSYHPESGDQDYSMSNQSSGQTTGSGEWYVNMYAVSIGRDSSLSQHYSSLLHLGNLKITQTE